MSDRKYWLVLFSGSTWKEFIDAGANVMGFKEHRKKSVDKLKSGDYLLCYITGLSRFIGVLEVTSKPFVGESRIWKDDVFPYRVKVAPVITLTLETSVPAKELKDKLSIVNNMAFPSTKWGACFQTSLAKWTDEDGDLVVGALHLAAKKPTHRPYNPAKLVRPAKRLYPSKV
jgi:predicted RNA-binding protein